MAYDEWIGKSTEREDVITQRLIDSWRATFAPHHSDAAMPEGLFWCLCPDIEEASALGADGHPRLGKFLPDLGLERRMWAGGTIRFYHDPQPHLPVIRTSIIKSIEPKEGRSGKMVFVTINHHYTQSDRVAVEEEQILVYRQAVSQSAKALSYEDWLGDDVIADTWSLCPDTTMLFRYSALTFNGHRIHYDKDFSIEHEGHDGLIIHGPIQASLIMSLAQSQQGQRLKHISYRSTSALICGHDIKVLITKPINKDGGINARGAICNHKGEITMIATLEMV